MNNVKINKLVVRMNPVALEAIEKEKPIIGFTDDRLGTKMLIVKKGSNFTFVSSKENRISRFSSKTCKSLKEALYSLPDVYTVKKHFDTFQDSYDWWIS